MPKVDCLTMKPIFTNRNDLIPILFLLWSLSSSSSGTDQPSEPWVLKDWSLVNDQDYINDNNIGIDHETLMAEKKAREEILKVLEKAQNSTDLTGEKSSRKHTKLADMGPIDIYLFLVMPLLMVRFAWTILQRLRPRHLKTQTTEYPLIPLIYFQQTENEANTKRDTKRQLSSISTNFIIRANQTYIDLDDIRNAANTRRTLSKSPWSLVRFMIRLQILYAKQRVSEQDKGKTKRLWNTVQAAQDQNKKMKARQILM